MFVLLAALIFGSCMSPKQIPYFQNADKTNLDSSAVMYDARIMPKDLLSIYVSTLDDAASAPFNADARGSETGAAGRTMNSYLVDNDGNINFPIIGIIHVAGLTKRECEQLILNKVKPFLSDNAYPMVTVRMSSFTITVLGEVNHPGVKTVSKEQCTIIDAIALAGDLTIYGQRNNIQLTRTDANGRKSVHYLNINEASIFNSPYFFLQQNDVLYVEPNSVKKTRSSILTTTSLWMSILSVGLTVLNLLK